MKTAPDSPLIWRENPNQNQNISQAEFNFEKLSPCLFCLIPGYTWLLDSITLVVTINNKSAQHDMLGCDYYHYHYSYHGYQVTHYQVTQYYFQHGYQVTQYYF